MKTKATLLIVDGNPFIAGILVQNLKDDFTITIANTGPEAARMLTQGNRFDCVLTELDLPFFNGLDLTKLIRTSRINRHIPVLILSSATDSDTRIKCLQHGADDFATKPFNPLEVKAKIQAVLRRAASPVYQAEEHERPVSARLLPEIKSFWQQRSRVLSVLFRGNALKQSA